MLLSLRHPALPRYGTDPQKPHRKVTLNRAAQTASEWQQAQTPFQQDATLLILGEDNPKKKLGKRKKKKTNN